MEGSKGFGGIGENGSSSEGRPPNPLSEACRQRFSIDNVTVSCKKTLVRHQSLVSSFLKISALSHSGFFF